MYQRSRTGSWQEAGELHMPPAIHGVLSGDALALDGEWLAVEAVPTARAARATIRSTVHAASDGFIFIAEPPTGGCTPKSLMIVSGPKFEWAGAP
jgi:hypothetical protein